jgi:nicotinate-nucleotide pyrophosphorylase (carboxylating)
MTGPTAWHPTAYDALPDALLRGLADAGLDPRRLYADVLRALAEDLPAPAGAPAGTWGEDVTSGATIPADARGTADFGAREPGVVAGLAVAELVFAVVLGDGVEVTLRLPDGSRVHAGTPVLRVAGPIRGLLTAERTALNYASHLSGVATATSRWVAALERTRARVLDTRKTLPGLRDLQKYAVRCGGGVNHRLGLSDLAMVKDNHVLAAGGVVPAWRAVRAARPDLGVEVEVTDLDQLRELLEAGCDHVLLDNMDTATMAEAVRVTAGRATLEASGGLTIERAREVAATGVDFISVGALTHSVTVFDLGMDLREETGRELRAAP